MDRYSGDFKKSRHRSLAGGLVGPVDLVGSALPRDLSMAGNPGAGSRAVMARDRWSSIYRFGTGGTDIGRCRYGLQLGNRRPFRPWRCHGHLVSGALSGLWQQPVSADVGTFSGFDRIALSAVGPKEKQKVYHSFYTLPDGGVFDPKGNRVDRRIKKRFCHEGKRGQGRGWIRDKYMRNRYMQGSFTIEAALLVPMILGILFLLLQTVVTLHDRVSEDAYRYEKLCCNEEQDSWHFVQIAGAILEEWEEWRS